MENRGSRRKDVLTYLFDISEEEESETEDSTSLFNVSKDKKKKEEKEDSKPYFRRLKILQLDNIITSSTSLIEVFSRHSSSLEEFYLNGCSASNSALWEEPLDLPQLSKSWDQVLGYLRSLRLKNVGLNKIDEFRRRDIDIPDDILSPRTGLITAEEIRKRVNEIHEFSLRRRQRRRKEVREYILNQRNENPLAGLLIEYRTYDRPTYVYEGEEEDEAMGFTSIGDATFV